MASGSSETPISPVATRAPDLTFSVPAINAQPVELDSTPTSPEKVRRGTGDAVPSAAEREVLSCAFS